MALPVSIGRGHHLGGLLELTQLGFDHLCLRLEEGRMKVVWRDLTALLSSREELHNLLPRPPELCP